MNMNKVIKAALVALGTLCLVLFGATAPASAAPGLWASVPQPTQVDNCGTDNDYFNYTNTGALDFEEVVNVDGTITVTATAKPGYKIKKNVTTEWTYPAFSDGCVILTDVPAPTRSDDCVWNFPNVEGVGYSLTTRIDGSGFTAYAHARPGYQFADGVQTSWFFGPC
jgi:hypothetical protein